MVVVRKLTPKTAGLNKAVLSDLVKKGPLTVLRIVGEITGAEEKKGDIGPYIRFSGKFSARSVLDESNEVRSTSMILPPVAEEAVVGLCGGLHKAMEEPVTVAFEIGIVPNTDSRSKDTNPYVWTVNTFGEVDHDDLFAKLWAQIDGKAAPRVDDKRGKRK